MTAPRYHHGQLRQALLDSALAIVDEVGVKALTLRAVARRANVSHTAPYRHFQDKAALLGAVAAQGFEQIGACMEAALTEAGPEPLSQFRAAGVAYVRFAVTHAAHYRLMFIAPLPAGDSAMEAAGDRAYGILERGIAACVDAGLFVDKPQPLLAAHAWATVHGIASLLIAGRLTLPGEQDGGPLGFAAEICSLLETGMVARPPA